MDLSFSFVPLLQTQFVTTQIRTQQKANYFGTLKLFRSVSLIVEGAVNNGRRAALWRRREELEPQFFTIVLPSQCVAFITKLCF